MKLVRIGTRGSEKPGLVAADGRGQHVQIKDVSAHVADYDHAFFAGGGLEKLRSLAASPAALPDVPAGVRIGAPVARPRNVFAIGLNYCDHAKETGAAPPSEPILFMKATSAVCGPHDPIIIPRGSEKTDWEVELGVVIGRDAHYLASKEAARAHIAGYCVANDVSERAFQIERGGQWSKGKSSANFLPLGPWLVTADEVPDPQMTPSLEIPWPTFRATHSRVYSSTIDSHFSGLPLDVRSKTKSNAHTSFGATAERR